jgi:uncharacterized membrane protein
MTIGVFTAVLISTWREAFAIDFDYVALNVSGIANGINNRGEIVGTFGLLDGEIVTKLDVPGSVRGNTIAYGIDDSGNIVGSYEEYPLDQGPKGFLYSEGSYTQFRFEFGVEILGINNDRYMVGRSCCQRGGAEGFIIYPSGVVEFFDVPGYQLDWMSSINSWGQIVGTFGNYVPSMSYGFLYSDGDFTTIEVANALHIHANGINDAGQIVGWYSDGRVDHGFFLDVDGSLTTVDFPGAHSTDVNGINNAGQIVGSFQDASGVHAFVAYPVDAPARSPTH